MRPIGMWGSPGRGKGNQGRVVRPLRGGEGHGKGREGQIMVERDRERRWGQWGCGKGQEGVKGIKEGS